MSIQRANEARFADIEQRLRDLEGKTPPKDDAAKTGTQPQENAQKTSKTST